MPKTKKVMCKFCSKREERGDASIIQCATCKGYCHASCLELPENIIPTVKTYDWQCNDCKYCYQCHDIANEEQILFCDTCDRGYHMYCAVPKLKRKPKGDWFCPICVENREKAEHMEVDDEEQPNPSDAADEIMTSTKKTEEEKNSKEDDTTTDEDNIPLKKMKVAHTTVTTSSSSSSSQDVNQNRLSKSTPSNRYSPAKACPFPGCDGSGNVKPANSVHFSLKACPLAREEKKREKELLGLNIFESPRKTPEDKENPVCHAATKPCTSSNNVLREEDQNTPSSSSSVSIAMKTTQTPIEHIVSSSDIRMFQQAKERAADLMALEKEILPNMDDRKIVVFGEIEIEAWYKSHYPLEFSKLKRVYICEFCLCYLQSETLYQRHMEKCMTKYPPGDEIYRKDNLSVFEVDGKLATIYCQNLCLFAKLFLDHKTLLNDVAPFLFYVMTVSDERGCHLIGYFSKEKNSFLNYNVSCILVLPQNMRQGYGKLLIEFSYMLSRVEGKVGSPERPLSDLGMMSYRKYWQDRLINYLLDYNDDKISIRGLSEKMAVHTNDIISTLQFLGLLKYWKGKHLIILKKEIIEEYSEKAQKRPDNYKTIDQNCLKWIPKTYK